MNEATIKNIGMRSFSSWLREMGVTPVTGWRMRRKNWVRTINIAGRQYITEQEMQNFQRRAEAGEFSKKNPIPTRSY